MARRSSVLNAISPLFVLLLLSCSPPYKENKVAPAEVSKSASTQTKLPDIKREPLSSSTIEDFIGDWQSQSGTDTLLIQDSEEAIRLRWTSTLDGSAPHYILCELVEGRLIGDYYGHTDNVSLTSEDGRLFFSVDPFAEFEPIRGMEFMKVVPVKKAVYLKPSEELVYSFDTKDGYHLSLAKAASDEYLVYRYGTKAEIQMEFPKDLSRSWSSFSYSYYLRGGGAENEGLDENLLRFNIGDIAYTVHDTYYAPEDQYFPALTITNERTGEEEEINGLPETIKGSLITLRDYEQLREEPEENIAWLGQNKEDEEAPDESLMLQESLGELRYHMRPSQVKEQVGLPDRTDLEEDSEMDGMTHFYWFYDMLGLKVELVSSDPDIKNAKVEVIIIEGDSPLVTDRWIGVGSSREEVMEAYSKELDVHQVDSLHTASLDTPDVLIIGELGGMQFKFKEDKVTEIILGRLIGS